MSANLEDLRSHGVRPSGREVCHRRRRRDAKTRVRRIDVARRISKN
jgi:hypothetical protein